MSQFLYTWSWTDGDGLEHVEEERYDLDLGDDHYLFWYRWNPDLKLNPQFERFRDKLPVERAGALVYHRDSRQPHGWCQGGGITLDLEPLREMGGARPLWQVESLDPLTISPSLLCRARRPDGSLCNDHGFIRQGRWVRA